MNLYFFQCQESFDNNIYLPYSSGILWSYINQFDEIKNSYILKNIFFEKIEVNKHIENLENPSVLLFSNYGWNTNYHLTLAKLAKEKYPNAIVIIGGPNAQQNEQYLIQHSYIDYVVWGEGETTLLELLIAIKNNNVNNNIKGISYIKDGNFIKTKTRERLTDLSEIPSPYLTGVFDSLFEKYNYNFMPVWETNRGCPYHCTFCDLGNDYYNKLFEFSTERLLKEIQWFSDKKIEYVEVADANFGILPRDLELVKTIKYLNKTTGFPKKISATWAKNSPDRVFEMSKILDSINRGGVTLALQSNNKLALDNIKRINIANDRLESIAKKYIDNNIQTYHDFILGLPGETLESWKNGLLKILEINPNGWIFGHPLEAYENTEFSDKNYIEKHKLKFVVTPQVSYFAKRNKNIPIEYGKYVVSTVSMSEDEYIEAFLFKWFLILMHSMGWANYTAIEISKKYNLKLSDFYLDYFDYVKNSESVINQEYKTTKEHLLNVLTHGNFWGRQIFDDSDIFWDYDSASSIVLQQNRNTYFNEFATYIQQKYNSDCKTFVFENNLDVINFNLQYPYKINKYTVSAENYTNFRDFCINIYWYGRRLRKYKTRIIYEG